MTLDDTTNKREANEMTKRFIISRIEKDNRRAYEIRVGKNDDMAFNGHVAKCVCKKCHDAKQLLECIINLGKKKGKNRK